MRHVLVSALAAAALVACGSAQPTPTAPPAPSNTPAPPTPAQPEPLPGPIQVGAVLSMTGPEAQFGVSTNNGIRLAIAERNEAGGVRGAKVELVVLDTQGKMAEVGIAVTRLIEHDHVVAIVGEVSSSLTLAGAAVAQEHGVPMITPAATNPLVTQVGDRIFRACAGDDAQARAMARFAREQLRVARVAVLADQTSAYSTGLAATFAAEVVPHGVTVAGLQYQGGRIDAKVLGAVLAAKVDAVYIPGFYTDAAEIALQLRKRGFRGFLLGGDGWDSAELAAIAGAAIDGAYYTNHFAIDDPRDRARDFAKHYADTYGTPPDALAALGYDATLVLLDALARAPALDGAALAAAIAATSLEGATGAITFGGARDPAKPVHVLEMKAQLPHFAASLAP